MFRVALSCTNVAGLYLTNTEQSRVNSDATQVLASTPKFDITVG